MPGNPQPLVSNQPIVNGDGTPTQYFIRWAQERQIDISGGISADQAQQLIIDWAAARHVVAGAGLTGGGPLSADVTLTLGDTLVTPGTYGDATHSAQITLDAEGRVQAAVQVPIAGGGGGGFPSYYAYDNTIVNTGSTPVPMTDVISVNIPASSNDRVFTVNGNISWGKNDHAMRGAVLLDGSTYMYPTNDGDNGIAMADGGDGKRVLQFSGVVCVVPGDGVAHTLSVAWAASGSTNGVTLSNRSIVATQIG